MESTIHEQIQAAIAAYLEENEKFEGKGVKAAASSLCAVLM